MGARRYVSADESRLGQHWRNLLSEYRPKNGEALRRCPHHRPSTSGSPLDRRRQPGPRSCSTTGFASIQPHSQAQPSGSHCRARDVSLGSSNSGRERTPHSADGRNQCARAVVPGWDHHATRWRRHSTPRCIGRKEEWVNGYTPVLHRGRRPLLPPRPRHVGLR